jgi:hypothetical protein
MSNESQNSTVEPVVLEQEETIPFVKKVYCKSFRCPNCCRTISIPRFCLLIEGIGVCPECACSFKISKKIADEWLEAAFQCTCLDMKNGVNSAIIKDNCNDIINEYIKNEYSRE